MATSSNSNPGTVTAGNPTTNNETNSLYNKYSRYVGGGTTEVANNMIEWWERGIMPRDSTDIVYTVENFYAGRPDLISNAFYNEPRYGWVICQYNNIIDPFGEIVAGRILLIPTMARLPLLLLTKQGGVNSTREQVNLISPIIT
jgi:hypothetical protein